MKTIATIYRPDGTEETRELDWPRKPGYYRIRGFIKPLLGGKGSNMEHVSVWWDGKPLDMFVDGLGQQKMLLRNAMATKIYRNYSVTKRFQRAEDLPYVVGVAVLFDRKVWF